MSACQFTNRVYRSSESYHPDYYYSGKFTNPTDAFLSDIQSHIDSKDYAITYNVTTSVSDDTVRYSGYYYGNLEELGFVYHNLSMRALNHQHYSDEKYSVVLSDGFSESSSFVTEQGSLPISGKVQFQVPSFAQDDFNDMGIKHVEVVMIQDETIIPDLNGISSIVIRGNDGFVQSYSRHPLTIGKELNQSALSMKTTISVLFQYAFLIPFCFILVFWSGLIRLSDVSSRKELALFRAFGYTKSKTRRLYFLENAFLSVPAFLINEVIFLPVFYLVLHFQSFMPWVLTLSALAYFLLYSYFYSCHTIRMLEKKSIL